MDTTDSSSAKERRIRDQADPLARIRELARVLQGPGGCPWDAEQTVESLTPYLQEEAFEVLEAIAEKDDAGFVEEMGDLFFLLCLLTTVAEAEGRGTLDAMAEGVVDKLVRRHPHVFGTGGPVGADGALQQWEELKRAERGGKEPEAVPTALGKRPAGLPALTTAFRISEKAAAVGFRWEDPGQNVEKVAEELGELRGELDRGTPDPERLEEELGDLLYATANLARHLSIDPERALRSSTAKFVRRFQRVEALLHEQGESPERSDLATMDTLWQQAKREEGA